MKKTLLFVAMALFTLTGAYAQEEGGEEAPIPVYTKSFQSVIDDAKFIVADNHYTKGQSELQKAIEAAEASIATLADNDAVREAMTTLQAAIDLFVTSNDYADATEKVQNPSFSIDGNNSKTITSWTVKNFKQNRRDAAVYSTTREGFTFTYFAEQWVAATNGSLSGSGDISQVVKGLPAGHYRLTADVFAHNQKYDATCEEAVGIQLYVNDAVREIGLTGLSDTQTAAFSLDFDVAEGQEPTIGFRFEGTNVNWLGWDNITLYYIGDPEGYNSIVNAEKIAAAKEALASALAAAKEVLASEDKPFYHNELQAAIDAAEALTESATLEELTEAKDNIDTAQKTFNDYNKHYTALKSAIEKAEALIAGGEMTVGVDQFQEAINTAKTQLSTAATDYADIAEGGAALTDEALDALNKAESKFRVLNASFANPANVITNGGMSSMDGWDVLSGGTANPALHINTSGNVTNFSKPFMECWVNNTNYGQQNYARQTVTALPDGQELPSGYYVLKAAALATRQDQADLKVSGVTLQFQNQEVAVQTENGIAKIYTIGFQKNEAGGELSFGLFIDEATDANWIAWDEVELQFVGDKNKYIADYTKAMLGESLDELKAALDKANKALEDIDLPEDFESSELFDYMDGAQYYLDNPTGSDVTKESIELQIQLLNESLDRFFTSGVSPKDGQYLNYTTLIKNADFDVTPGSEWTVETENGVLPGGTDCVNWWFGSSGPDETTQEFSQTLSGLPAGNYLLDVNAAIRVDMNYSIDGYKAENLPSNVTLCKVYANNDSVDVHPFFYEDEAKGLTLEKMLEMTNDYDYRHGNGTLIDEMLKTSELYHSYISFTLEKEGNVKIGFRVELPKKGGQMPFIDYFHLYYYGKQDVVIPGEETAIAEVKTNAKNTNVYNLKGQLMRVGTSTQGLSKGLYIIGGKKVLVR